MPSTNKIKSCGRRKRLRYFESTVDLIARKIITSNEEFNHNQVHTLLLSLKSRKSLCHSKLRCEPDGIRLKRTSKLNAPPPRKFYSYKDIERYYVFDNDPTILILGCIDHEQNSRYYDFFKLPESHYKDITTLINKARSHSDYILNEDDTTLPTPGVYSSHSSLNISTEHLQQNNLSIEENINLTQNEPPIDNTELTSSNNDIITNDTIPKLQIDDIQQNTDNSLREDKDDKDDVVIHNHYVNHDDFKEDKLTTCECSPYQPSIEVAGTVNYLNASPSLSSSRKSSVTNSLQPKLMHNNENNNHDDDDDDKEEKNSLKLKFYKLKEKDKTFAKLTENINVNDLSAMDFRYVKTHPEHGNYIVDNSDVYIFIAHYKQPENIKNFKNYNNNYYIHNDDGDNGDGDDGDDYNIEHETLDKLHKKNYNTADKSFSLRYV
ncbi:hypothetical protein MN116_005953 [Schistosoma mekongi]|uniref:Trematode PH-like domain-containing protein n=1 Tax=Schistosoma mekongi TaxID=38744 RepID=A0AAE2D521_SCHME|nr:hypothetical protein MN116_005953 [Schistosoma mekongi]